MRNEIFRVLSTFAAFLFLSSCVNAAVLGDHFLELLASAGNSARASATGNTFCSLGDDPSTLFINPAGLITVEGSVLYGEYVANSRDTKYRAVRTVAAVPYEKAVFSAGYYRTESGEDIVADIFALGTAVRILQGTQGSFLSAGLTLKSGRLSRGVSGDCISCGSTRFSDSAFSTDFGIMLRPLPMVSFGYSVENLQKPELEYGDGSVLSWERNTRWGGSVFWREKVILAWQKETAGNKTGNHFGLIVMTNTPLEFMSGFHDEKVSGGLRWDDSRFDLLVSFTPDGGGGVDIHASFEILFKGIPLEVKQ
ncbi:MAG: hypothetical protein KAV42_00420 [Candidatus Krumholzibacteria bacterium]|nr:hypothetical protein [Candidatus Krumholzibacteria bacterium]